MAATHHLTVLAVQIINHILWLALRPYGHMQGEGPLGPSMKEIVALNNMDSESEFKVQGKLR